MPNAGRFPRKDVDFNTYLIALMIYLVIPANKLRLIKNEEYLTELSSNYVLWDANWLKINDPAQRTLLLLRLKTSLLKIIKQNCNTIFADIPNSFLTDLDRVTLLVFARMSASSLPVASYAVVMTLDSMGHLWAKIKFINSATPSSKSLPKGNVIFLEYYIGLHDLIESAIPFANGKIIRTSSYTLAFTSDKVGQTCYVRAFYENKMGDRSISSVILSFVIS